MLESIVFHCFSVIKSSQEPVKKTKIHQKAFGGRKGEGRGREGEGKGRVKGKRGALPLFVQVYVPEIKIVRCGGQAQQ